MIISNATLIMVLFLCAIVLKRTIFGPMPRFSGLALALAVLGIILSDVQAIPSGVKVQVTVYSSILFILSVLLVQASILIEMSYLRNKPN